MDVREQDKEGRKEGSSSYAHILGESTSSDRRRPSEANHNGVSVHHHLHQQNDVAPDRAHGNEEAAVPTVPIRSKQRTPSSSSVRYRECLKNHAASIGGNIFDGCGEFMPSGEEGTIEALKCAACDCHRNFHRKEVDGETQFGPNFKRSSNLMLSHLQLPPPLPSPHQKFSVSLNLHSSSPAPIVAPMNVAFGGGGGGTESSSEDLNVFHSKVDQSVPPLPFSLSKKRFRTKFSQEQKERMQEFAEKLGWRFHKQDEEEVERFCAQVGVKRQVFKVWMHNNKNTIKKQNETPQELSLEMTMAGEADINT